MQGRGGSKYFLVLKVNNTLAKNVKNIICILLKFCIRIDIKRQKKIAYIFVGRRTKIIPLVNFLNLPKHEYICMF